MSVNSFSAGSSDFVIDCDSCQAKPLACGGCVVTFMLGASSGTALESEDVRMLDVLAGSGLVPPLRLVNPESGKIAG